MWEPRRLTTLLASIACYRDSFTFYVIYIVSNECIVTCDMLFILRRVDPLLGDCTAVIARERPANSNRRAVFSVRSMPRCYKQYNWSNELVVRQSLVSKKVSTEAEDIVEIRHQGATADD
jgi:hypothetical protein